MMEIMSSNRNISIFARGNFPKEFNPTMKMCLLFLIDSFKLIMGRTFDGLGKLKNIQDDCLGQTFSNCLKKNSMANEIDALKEKLDKLEGQNAELNQQNADLMEQNKEMNEQIVELADQNAKLAEQNAKLLKENEMLKGEKLQPKNQAQSIVSNPSSQKMVEEKLADLELEEKMIAKNAKSTSRTYVQNWLFETLEWVGRKEMADSALSTSSKTFKQLCWPKLHGNVKPHEVNLEFQDKFDEESGTNQPKLVIAKGWEWTEIPIASIEPPNYIIGFSRIAIFFLNGQVMKFIECILPNINAFNMYFRPMTIPIWHSSDKITQIHCLYEMLAKKAVSIRDENFFEFLRLNPNAFGLIENVQSILANLTMKEHINLLLQWLIQPFNGQKPKMVSIHIIEQQLSSKFIDRIKEQFIGSTQSVNFIISFNFDPNYPNFNMENEQTGEVLALYDKYFLVRHQKGEEHLRADWEKKLLQTLPRVIVQITNTGEF